MYKRRQKTSLNTRINILQPLGVTKHTCSCAYIKFLRMSFSLIKPSFFTVLLRLATFVLLASSAHVGRYAKDTGWSSGTVDEGTWVRHGLIGQGPRQEHSVTSIDRDIYILGGVAYDEHSEVETLNRVEVYSVADQTWRVAAPLPTPLNHGNAAAVDDKIYVLGSLSGGKDWSAISDTYVYQSFNDTWSALTAMPSGTARGSSAVGG